MINRRLLKKLAGKHGTPLFVGDHAQLHRDYARVSIGHIVLSITRSSDSVH